MARRRRLPGLNFRQDQGPGAGANPETTAAAWRSSRPIRFRARCTTRGERRGRIAFDVDTTSPSQLNNPQKPPATSSKPSWLNCVQNPTQNRPPTLRNHQTKCQSDGPTPANDCNPAVRVPPDTPPARGHRFRSRGESGYDISL